MASSATGQEMLAPTLAAEPVEAPAPATIDHTPPPPAVQGFETLQQAWQQAVAVNPQLQSKQHLVAANRAATKAAYAEHYPNVQVGAGYTVRDREPAYRVPSSTLLPTGGILPSAQSEAFSFQTTIEVPVYTAGRIGHEVAAARAERQAAEHDYRAAAATLKLRVAEAYVAVLREQEVLGVAVEREENLRTHLADAKQLLAHDHLPRSKLLAAEVSLANASQQRLQAQQRLETSRSNYNRLLGRTLTSPVRLAALGVPSTIPNLESFCLLTDSPRPEVARLRTMSNALDQQAKAVRAGRRPQFELLGQYAFEENRFRDPEGIAALAFGVQWNAFDGARARHRARALQSQAIGYRRAMSDRQDETELEIRKAWLAAKEALQRTRVAQQALDQAAEHLQNAAHRQQNGMASHTQLQDARLLQAEARLNHHHAVCDAVLAACRLRHATGDL